MRGRRVQGFGALLAAALLAACGAATPSSCPPGTLAQGATCVDPGTGRAICSAPLLDCGTAQAPRCVDPANDPAHCGACGQACPAGQVCAAGACGPSCPAPLSVCGAGAEARCALLAVDPANCGACGQACRPGQACAAGACVATCDGAGGTLCGGQCVQLASDAAHCGACGNACPRGTTCALGVCQPTCPAGQVRCGDRCVDLRTDEASCGACGRVCPAFAVCEAGACIAPACRGEVGLPGPPDLFAGRVSTVAVADLDGDGLLDLVTNDASDILGPLGSTVLVHRNLGGRRFAPPVPYPAGIPVGWIRLADVDGDGRLDALVSSGTAVAVLRGTAGGGFEPLFTPQPLGLAFSADLALGDLDGDGRPDVVAAGFGLSIVRTLAGGELSAAGRFISNPQQFFPRHVALADMDGDGKLDVVAAEEQGGRVGVYLNIGGGGLAAPVTTFVGELFDVATGDLDGDGRPDVAVSVFGGASPSAWGVATLHNRGDGTLDPPVYRETGFFPLGVLLADVDGDGALDLVVANWGDARRVDVFRNAGDGTLLPAVAYFDEGASDFAVADLDGDGRRDLVLASAAGSGVHVLWGEGPRLAAPPAFPGPHTPLHLALADVDGDGRLDAVGADAAGISIWRGAGDGTFQAPSSLDLAGLVDVAAGDLDGDGKADLVVITGSGVRVLLRRADGFVEGAPLDGLFPAGVSLVDVDGDGRLDVVGLSRDFPRQPVLQRGAGDGTFGAAEAIMGGAGASLAVGLVADLDGDGRPDLLLTDGNGLAVALNLGGGIFGPALPAIGGSLGHAAVGDLDGDGWIDLAVTDPGGTEVRVLFGRGDGTFEPTVVTVPVHRADPLAIIPLRGARQGASLVVRGGVIGDVGRIDFSTDRKAGPVQRWAAGDWSSGASLAWTDLDGDLRADVVVGNLLGITVLRSACLR